MCHIHQLSNKVKFSWHITVLTLNIWIPYPHTILVPIVEDMVNVLKFGIFYSILFWRKFCVLCNSFLKIHGGMANSLDPDQNAPSLFHAPSGAVWSESTLFANSLDPDQNAPSLFHAPSGAVWSESTLFAYAILSEFIGVRNFKIFTSLLVRYLLICLLHLIWVFLTVCSCLSVPVL